MAGPDIRFDKDEMDGDPARVALPVLFDPLPRLPEDRGMVSFSGSMIRIRATLRFLKRIPTEETQAEIVRLVLADTRSLNARLILLRGADPDAICAIHPDLVEKSRCCSARRCGG